MSESMRGVLWREGLFLRPHHLQRLATGLQATVARLATHAQPYAWGIVALDVDPLKLEEGEFEIRRLEVALPSGEVALFGDDESGNARVESKAIPQTSEGHLTVYVGVRRLREQEPNVGELGRDEFDPPRYTRTTARVADLTSGRNLQELELTDLNVRLFFEGDRIDGFEVVPVARLEAPAVGLPLTRLSRSYAPPCLRVDASAALHTLVKELYAEGAKKAADLANAATPADIVAGRATQAEQMQILKLWTLRGALPLLREAADGGHVHPYTLYVHLCELLGQFGTLSEGAGAHSVPRYDHLDVGGCYGQVLAALMQLLRTDRIASNWKRIPLRRINLPFGGLGVGAKDIDPEWLTGRNQFYLVFANPDPSGRQLDWYRSGHVKVAAFSRIGAAVTQRKFGVVCAPCEKPSTLPARDGAMYYRLDTQSAGAPETREEWEAICRERTIVAHFRTEGLAPGQDAPDLGIEAYVVFGR